MINKEGLIGGVIGTALSSAGAGISLEQMDRILSIVCSAVGVIITIVSCLIIPLIRWYKKAKEDGKISKEELEEGKEIINNGVKEIKDSVEDTKKK